MDRSGQTLGGAYTAVDDPRAADLAVFRDFGRRGPAFYSSGINPVRRGLSVALGEPTVSGERGEFWLGEAPAGRITGAVDFAGPLAGHLVLDGELSTNTAPEPLVLGLLFNGRRISAFVCHPAGRTQSYTGDDRYTRQVLAVTTFVIGEHLHAEPLFDRVDVYLSQLSVWANTRQGWGSPVADEQGYSVRYERPPERTAAFADLGLLTLRAVDGLTTSQQSLVGTQRTAFSVAFSTAASFDVVGRTVATLRDLVSFGSRRPAAVVDLRVTCPGVLISRGIDVQAELELRDAQIAKQSSEADRPDPPYWEYLFLAPDTSAEFDELIGRWVELEDRLSVMLDMFLALRYQPPYHLENQIMNICQAAEGYHRRTLDHELMPAEEYRDLSTHLTEACPESRRDWLRALLTNANGPSFRVRVDELVGRAGDIGTRLSRCFANYPARLRDARNAFAHVLGDTAIPDNQIVELADLFDVTRLLLEACVLQDLGMSPEAAAQAIDAQRDFQRVMRRRQA